MHGVEMTRYTPARHYLSFGIVAAGLAGFSAWLGRGWMPAYIPAGLFVLSSALLLVLKTLRRARAQKHLDIANACFCDLLSMAGFLVAITFLANAYRYYVPVMIALAVSLHFSAADELDRNAGNAGAATT